MVSQMRARQIKSRAGHLCVQFKWGSRPLFCQSLSSAINGLHKLVWRWSSLIRAQADAVEIEALAKRRLADEYDAAQERGEVAGPAGGGERSGRERSPLPATVTDLGLTRKQVHEARQTWNAEAVAPGVVRRTFDGRRRATCESQTTGYKRQWNLYWRRSGSLYILAITISCGVP